MKIEASEGAYGEGGAVVCSVPELLPPIAQDGQASIGPRLQQQQQPGCGPADGPFDCEHFQFIDDSDDDEAMSGPLKSLLKRGRSGHGRNVTFDEAVTLYCDDGEGVQLLQLTTGPDIVAEAAYYGMFEPPIEYQDIEPPAEYRDSDDPPEPAPVVEEPPPPPVVVFEEEEEEMVVDKVEVEVVEPTKEEVVVEVVEEEEEDPLPSPNESDKLIERFLEAEGVFPVDEELNSVFRELHSDFMGDGQNGTLDDTLFRNLISFLSNAEEIPLEAGDFFSTTKFEEEDVTPTASQEVEEDGLHAHSRTLSEADSDCSISSQDTIIVRLGEEEGEQQHQQSERGGKVAERVKAFESQVAAKPIPEPRLHKQESLDEVFNSDRSTEVDSRPVQPPPRPLPRESIPQKIQQQQVIGEESLSRQSSGETSVTDPPADADDSTSSDSRSGEVEEEMRLDDIGYDEEDADDYDEESFRGMAHGNSKIRRIIKKNALQCTLFRGIEAKRRQQPGIKYPRPKSPLLSQESLVEKLKWLTTVDEPKEGEGGVNFHSKPPDVILSTGGIPVNGSIPHGGAEEHNPSAMSYPQQFYQMQRFAMTPNAKGGYYVRHDGYHPSLPRPRMAVGPCPGGHPMPPPPPGWRMMAPWAAEQQQQPQQQQNRSLGSLTVPRNFRDWRVIQRVMVGRSDQQQQQQQQQQLRTGGVPADYVRCSPGVATNGPRTRDELEQFVEQDSQRLDRIRKRYSVAEDDDDPTFGFARRPSVRGVQGRIQTHPSEQPPIPEDARYGTWNGGYRGPMHIHRASVALTELPGNATIPYAHRKHADPRYHSYAESMYGSTRTLPAKGWDPRMMLQVVPPPPAKDERGVPEGASSSPKISSDSLYHSPVVPDPIPPGGAPPRKDEGVIYYSLNV